MPSNIFILIYQNHPSHPLRSSSHPHPPSLPSASNILKIKARTPRHRPFRRRGQPLPLPTNPPLPSFLLPSKYQRPHLAPFLHSHHIHNLTARRAPQARRHLFQRIQLVEAQLPLEHRGRLLLIVLRPNLHQPFLQRLHERHRFLHLAHLCDFAVQLLFPAGGGAQARFLEFIAHEGDVFFLPGGVVCGGEDGEFLGEFRVKGDGFAFVLFLQLCRFGGGDGRCGGADVVTGCGEGGAGGGDGGVEGGLDGGWLEVLVCKLVV